MKSAVRLDSSWKYTRNCCIGIYSAIHTHIAGFYFNAAYNARLAALGAVLSSSFSDPLASLLDAPSFTG
jgi:hypothetical protein